MRIRETLFNWLSPHIAGARCLDLFAGTGALGLEALSRGAMSAVFVEKSARAAAALNDNIDILGAAAAVVINMDARQYLAMPREERFDIVFLDPPFAEDMLDELCRLLEESGLLAARCRIYIEQPVTGPDATLPETWQVLKNKTAGNVRYMLVTREGLTGKQR